MCRPPAAFEELVVPISALVMQPSSEREAEAAAAESNGGEREGPKSLGDVLGTIRSSVDTALESYAASPLAPTVVRKEILPLFKQVGGSDTLLDLGLAGSGSHGDKVGKAWKIRALTGDSCARHP